jgi:mono/diheme cytochrome c family protein
LIAFEAYSKFPEFFAAALMLTHAHQVFRFRTLRRLAVLALILARVSYAAVADVSPAAPDAPNSEGIAFFEKRIRPLLAKKCYECHATDAKKIKGGLLLDSRAGWTKGGDTGPAIVPGKPEESLLIKAVSWSDPDMQMPPKNKLAPDQIAALAQWVKMGAPDPRAAPETAGRKRGMSLDEGRRFWAFRPVKNESAQFSVLSAQSGETTTQQSLSTEHWALSTSSPASAAIDAFIFQKLREHNIPPAPPADRATLIRRAYFDLIGLPPTPEQIDTFVGDTRADAFARVIDELLASPHFGERWGGHWLDVARFAESSGGGRTLLFKDAWRYRDYVIDAFNADMPFDQFVREQVAGDLLPAGAPAQHRRQLTATGFLALGPTNYEEQDKAALRMDVVDEQIETIGKGFLGMTIGCARCHDHKFDPIPTRDYYALAGILRSTRTLKNYKDNVARWIDTPLPQDAALDEKISAHEKRIAAVEEQIAAAKEAAKKASAQITRASTKPGQPIAASALPGIIVDDSEAKIVGEWRHSQFSKSYIGDGYLTDDGKKKGELTLTFVPPLPASGRYEVRLAYPALSNRVEKLPVTIFHADGENTVFVDQRETPPIDGRFVSLGQYRFERGGEGYVLISNADTKGSVCVDAVQFLSVEELAAEEKKAPQDPALDGAAKKAAAEVKRIEKKLKELEASGPARPVAMAVRDDEDDIADCRVHIRGSYKNLGEPAPRGFLTVALRGPAPSISEKESGRRQLGEWIASADNPLTARVFANRVWHWLFGAGIVRTVDNFGSTGELPSHPELLDFLAARFVEDGWSVKKIVREVMLSRTYQLAPVAPASDNPQSIDPENRLLWRANIRRLDAESIRDAILAVSGELKLDVGGPNIAGAGTIDANTTAAQNTEYGYKFTDTRRSVYTPAFRNVRLELFEAFDFGNINATMGARNTSTVATQALYLLNHPFVIEQSRLAARRALADATLDDAAQIDRAYRVALGRLPTETEKRLALDFVESPGNTDEKRLDAWAEFYQTLFACVDFRYLN